MSTPNDSDTLLRQQIAYYRARAGEYDEWFLRQGHYDRGPELNARWFAEVEQVRAALDTFHPTGDVLELAAGTGLWTQRLVRTAAHVTAVDAAPEVLALNRERLKGEAASRVTYVQADLFTWAPDRRYDAVFFGFWLSHVPPERFDGFWTMVRSALKPGGRVFFVDSLYAESSMGADSRRSEPDASTVTRRLNDGQRFRIVKVYYRPEELHQRLADLGWDMTVSGTQTYFVFGSGAPRLSP